MGRKRRVVTPTVLQMEATECGAAALAMVLAYHGRVVPLEELREVCGVSRDGSKASNVVTAAQRYGLVAKGYKQEPEQLPELPLPMIVFWNFNHFVVVEGFGRREVYLNDPAWGRRVVSDKEFSDAFTGVVLTFEPDTAFQKGGKPTRLWTYLWQGLGTSWDGWIYVWLLSLMLVLPGLVVPALGRMFVDHYLVGGMQSWLVPLLVGLGMTAVLRGVLVWLQQAYLLRLETKMAVTSAARFVWHLLTLPVVFFQQRYRGALGARVRSYDRLAQLFSGELASAWLQVSMVVFFFGLMGYYDMPLAVVCLLLTSLNGLLLWSLFRRHQDWSMRLLIEREKVSAATVGGLSSIESFKAMGMESVLFGRWVGLQTRVLQAEQRMGLVAQSLYVVPTSVGFLSMAVVLLWGAWRVMDGAMTLGTLVAFQSLMASVNEPVLRLLGLGKQWQEASGEVARLEDVMRYPAAPEFTATPSQKAAVSAERAAVSAERAGVSAERTGVSAEREAIAGELASGAVEWGPETWVGALEVRGVSYGHNPQEPALLQNIDLQIEPGQQLALVGATGCGKSTLARLVCGLYTPWAGEICMDGVPLLSMSRSVRTHVLAMVSQDITLFAGSVRDNLTLWNPAISEINVIQAAKDACIHEDIVRRRGGYDALVAENGRNWSGGQRQRLELARALVNHPVVLVLDEATSALDPLVEQEIMANLRRRGCTCLWIAHRWSTILGCDVVAVLEQGRIVRHCTPYPYRDSQSG